jgi:ABC-2 type transport system permease protein
MRQAIEAEVRKLLTTRTAYGVLAGMLILAGPGIFMSGETEVGELSRPLEEQVWFFIAVGFSRLLVVVLGIRAVTDEIRCGTIVPSVLTMPDRRRLVAAKALTLAGAGLIGTVVAEIVMVGVAALYVTSRGAELSITSGTVRALVGTALAGALWAVAGVALGATIRHQIPAIVGSLLWLIPGGGIEAAIEDRLGSFGSYLPGNGGMALALAPDGRALWWGAAVLGAYAAALLVAGSYLAEARDVT